MAKYCANCGRKLEEGEVCDCQEVLTSSNIDFGESVNKLINLIKGMFTSPIKTMKAFKEENNFSLACVLVAITSIITGLFLMLLTKGLYEATVSTYTIGSYSVVSSVDIPYFRVFVIGLLTSIVFYFIEALVLYLVNSQIFKVKFNYKNAFNIISALSVFNLIAILISIIGIFISIYVAIIIIAIATILNLICLVMASKEILKLNDKNTMYSIILYLLIMAFISYIAVLIFN